MVLNSPSRIIHYKMIWPKKLIFESLLKLKLTFTNWASCIGFRQLSSTMVFPTSTMIQEALTCIRRQKGTNLTEIHKHLEANHNKKLDGSNKRMLTSMLRGLVTIKQLQKKNSNYKLAISKKVPTKDVPARRHRRRSRRRHHRRRHHRRRRGGRRHHKHCKRSYRYKRGQRVSKMAMGHRHCPRRWQPLPTTAIK